jgi:predicted nucleotidyltransferase
MSEAGETVGQLRHVLEQEPRIAFALLFGSVARETSSPHSDMDIAVGLQQGVSLTTRDIGSLIADLERAAGRAIDLVLLESAPPALAYRVFRDGVVLVERDHRALAERKARAILDYLDFRPIEEIAVRGALAAAARGR